MKIEKCISTLRQIKTHRKQNYSRSSFMGSLCFIWYRCEGFIMGKTSDDPLFYPKKERLHKTIAFCGIFFLVLGGAVFYKRKKKDVSLAA